MNEPFYLAFISGRVEPREARPTDTDFWLGPYTWLEIFTCLSPNGDLTKIPSISAGNGEWAGSRGLKPIHFSATYDAQSRSVILFDFGGYVGTVRTAKSLWEALLYQAENGPGSLRELTRVPQLPNSKYRSSAEQAEINRQVAEFMEKAAKQKQEKEQAKTSKLSIEDLGLG